MVESQILFISVVRFLKTVVVAFPSYFGLQLGFSDVTTQLLVLIRNWLSLHNLCLVLMLIWVTCLQAEVILNDVSLTQSYVDQIKPDKKDQTGLKTDFEDLQSKQEVDPWKPSLSLHKEDEKDKPDHRLQILSPYLDSLRLWRNSPRLIDLKEILARRDEIETKEEGINLPLNSNLKITKFGKWCPSDFFF